MPVFCHQLDPDTRVRGSPEPGRSMTGILHGGVLMSLGDTTGALVAFLAVPLHRGRTAATIQTSLYDDAGRLVAQTTQIQAIRQLPG